MLGLGGGSFFFLSFLSFGLFVVRIVGFVVYVVLVPVAVLVFVGLLVVVLVFVGLGVVGTGLVVGVDLPPMEMSAHDLNVSWAPHPKANVSFLHLPQLLPEEDMFNCISTYMELS